MKLSISNIGWTKEDDEKVYAKMRELGFTGLEIAPTRIFPEKPYAHRAEAAAWAKDLKKAYGFSVPSMQSIWYGRTERVFGTKREREALLAYTKRAIRFAEAVGCGNLVFGCPRNRTLPEGKDPETAVAFFKALGDDAAIHGTSLSLEANPPIYHTNYINDTASALELIQKVDSPGFGLNLDVGTMVENGERIELLKGNVRFIRHVHVSEPGLKPIEHRALHQELKALLTRESYDGFISIEMGNGASLRELFDAMAYVKGIFQ